MPLLSQADGCKAEPEKRKNTGLIRQTNRQAGRQAGN
jgi:hypothetical protein